MKQAALRILLVIQFLLIAGSGALFAQSDASIDTVTCKTNRSLLHRGGQVTLLTETLSMAKGIKVLTNATYCVNKGAPRPLQEGQVLRSDGFILNPDGSTFPIFDHIAMSGAQVMVWKDGAAEPLSQPMDFPDGAIVNPDGTYARGIRSSRLVDGQLITLEGIPITGLDTITFRDGRVVVFKSGALIPLQNRDVYMGMFDSSRIRGDGQRTLPDGTVSQMADGEVITLPGVRADW